MAKANSKLFWKKLFYASSFFPFERLLLWIFQGEIMQRFFLWQTVWLSAFFCACNSAKNVSPEVANHKVASVEFIDVGQGLSALFQIKEDDFAAVYDTGNDSVGFWDSLQSRGIRHLDFAVISHWHRDHVGGLLEWNGNIPIDTIFYSPDSGGIWLRDSVLNLSKRFRAQAIKVQRGKSLPCGDWNCKVLWPSEFAKFTGNNASVVLQISDGTFRVLLTGDLESDAEESLLDLSHDLRAEILQVGHHGSGNSSSLHFLEQIAPKIAVISVGRENSYGHPTPTTLNKLTLVTGDSSRILRTDRHSNILFEWKFRKGLWQGNF